MVALIERALGSEQEEQRACQRPRACCPGGIAAARPEPDDVIAQDEYRRCHGRREDGESAGHCSSRRDSGAGPRATRQDERRSTDKQQPGVSAVARSKQEAEVVAAEVLVSFRCERLAAPSDTVPGFSIARKEGYVRRPAGQLQVVRTSTELPLGSCLHNAWRRGGRALRPDDS